MTDARYDGLYNEMNGGGGGDSYLSDSNNYRQYGLDSLKTPTYSSFY
jgi:hypothetical protein